MKDAFFNSVFCFIRVDSCHSLLTVRRSSRSASTTLHFALYTSFLCELGGQISRQFLVHCSQLVVSFRASNHTLCLGVFVAEKSVQKGIFLTFSYQKRLIFVIFLHFLAIFGIFLQFLTIFHALAALDWCINQSNAQVVAHKNPLFQIFFTSFLTSSYEHRESSIEYLFRTRCASSSY